MIPQLKNFKMENKWKMEPGKWTIQRGFTLVELMVSIGILLILFALTTINITRLPSSTAQSSSYDRLVSDLRSQQTKAMVGSSTSYGVHFETTSYTIFTGLNYSPGDSSNFVVSLDPNLTFASITFPASQVVFLPGSGDVSGLTGGSTYSVSISNSSTGDPPKVIKINKYGATN